MERKEAEQKAGRFEFRISRDTKQKLKSLSKEYGISMGEILSNFINDLPIENIKDKREQFHAIHNLSKEINYIGKNINQITMALRQIAAGRKEEDGQLHSLYYAIGEYERKLEEVKSVLLKNF